MEIKIITDNNSLETMKEKIAEVVTTENVDELEKGITIMHSKPFVLTTREIVRCKMPPVYETKNFIDGSRKLNMRRRK